MFISYRREDSIGIAGRIRDRLVKEFTADQVFFDIDTIPLGVDFRTHIDQTVAGCDVMLVLIGHRWADTKDGQGQRRLDQPGDSVRLEVEAALRRQIRVIPVLVDGASIPPADALPESLASLAFRNGIQVRYDPDFHTDVDRLIRGLRAQPVESGEAAATELPATGPAYPGQVLERGSRGQSVRQWQARMAERGWTLSVDGTFGDRSDRVCRQFQREKGLEVDGIVGPETWTATWNAPLDARGN